MDNSSFINEQQQREKIRQRFVLENALTAENAIDGSICDDFDTDVINALLEEGLLKKTADDRYYLDTRVGRTEASKKNNGGSKGLKIALIALGVCVVVFMGLFLIGKFSGSSNGNTQVVKNEYVRFEVPEGFEVEEYGEDDDDIGWTIYSPAEDEDGYCYIFVTLYDCEGYTIDDIEDQYGGGDFADAKIKQYKTKKGNPALNVVTVYEEYNLYIDDVVCKNDDIEVEIFCYYVGNGKDYIKATDLIADTVVSR